PIPRTPEDSKKESDDDEEQESRLSEEARIQEEEKMMIKKDPPLDQTEGPKDKKKEIGEEEVVETKKILMLLMYLEHQTRLLEVVGEVAVVVGTQKEFLVSHVSLFSSCELHQDLLEVDLNNHAPMTSVVPQTNSYDHHKPGRSCLQTSVIGNFLYINDRQITKASMKWSLHCPINCISTNLINGFAHFIRNIEIL
nr:hypothetical protein [Tanacetum cinerariifolium]